MFWDWKEQLMSTHTCQPCRRCLCNNYDKVACVCEIQLLVSIPNCLCLLKDAAVSPLYISILQGRYKLKRLGRYRLRNVGGQSKCVCTLGICFKLLPAAACQLAKVTKLRTASFLELVFIHRKVAFNRFSVFETSKKIHKKATSKHTSKKIHYQKSKTTFLQEAAIAAVSGEDAAEPQEEEGMPSGFGSTSSLPGSHSNGGEDSEVARFGAVKEKKYSLENGISVFNRCSLACVS